MKYEDLQVRQCKNGYYIYNNHDKHKEDCEMFIDYKEAQLHACEIYHNWWWTTFHPKVKSVD